MVATAPATPKKAKATKSSTPMKALKAKGYPMRTGDWFLMAYPPDLPLRSPMKVKAMKVISPMKTMKTTQVSPKKAMKAMAA